ncbi:MAG: Fur family transcriptional regulator [Jatrophihabitans sp.]
MTHPSELADRLRERGLRMTSQRQQVLDAVRELEHATPEQVAAAVAGVDLTTVYRALELLEELGLVAHTHLGHGAPSYRMAGDHHVHIVCHDCGSVVDAEPALARGLRDRLRTKHDFELDLSHFTVFGRCGKCGRDRAEREQPGAAER